MSIYIDFHVLQTVPPSCVNRDDTGSPKTAMYGGAVRARVSSQAWKHAMREYFEKYYDDNEVGIRTKNILEMISAEIKEIDSSIDDKKALALAEKFARTMANKKNGKDVPILKLEQDKYTKEYRLTTLVFLSKAQVRAIAQAAINDATSDEYKKAFLANPSADIALFGRMVAEDPGLGYDAAAQVAHAISTHAVHNEYDYFTACDDLQKEDNAGAGHLGTVEFNSSTLYRYANVNATELAKTIGTEKVAEAIAKFGQAFIHSMPTGKENTFANRTLPDAVYVTLRSDQPVNLCGAFEQPVKPSNEGFAVPSEKKLASYAKTVYEKFAARPVAEWCVSSEFGTSVKSCTLPDLLTELETAIASVIGEE